MSIFLYDPFGTETTYFILYVVSVANGSKEGVDIRVIHEKSNFKFLTSSSHILFILVIKYLMQNFSSFEQSLEGATSISNFVHKVNRIFWSFMTRGLNIMIINLNVAENLLDM